MDGEDSTETPCLHPGDDPGISFTYQGPSTPPEFHWSCVLTWEAYLNFLEKFAEKNV